jgi:hypothetical protein
MIVRLSFALYAVLTIAPAPAAGARRPKRAITTSALRILGIRLRRDIRFKRANRFLNGPRA